MSRAPLLGLDRVPLAAIAGQPPGPVCPDCCVVLNERRRLLGRAPLPEADTWLAAIIPPRTDCY